MRFLRHLTSSLVLSVAACVIILLLANVVQFFTARDWIVPNWNGLELLGGLCVISSFLRALALSAEDLLCEK